MASWTHSNSRTLLLALPKHDQSLLPAPRRLARPLAPARALRFIRSVVDRGQDMQVVNEFRNKLRLAEDLISKLAYSLREIQGTRNGEKSMPSKNSVKNAILVKLGKQKD